MTPGEMADRVDKHVAAGRPPGVPLADGRNSSDDYRAAAAMLREAERLLLSAEPTYRTEHIRAEWAMARGAWLEGTA